MRLYFDAAFQRRSHRLSMIDTMTAWATPFFAIVGPVTQYVHACSQEVLRPQLLPTTNHCQLPPCQSVRRQCRRVLCARGARQGFRIGAAVLQSKVFAATRCTLSPRFARDRWLELC
jgi:hypothetical protein